MGPKKPKTFEILEQPTVEPTVIILKILEIYNLSTDDERENIMDVTFMNEKLSGEGEIQFNDCACRPEMNPISKWTLKLNGITEETLMDLSANPLVITISKIQTEPIGELQNMNAKKDRKLNMAVSNTEVVAYSCVDLCDLVNEEIKIIQKTSTIVLPVHPVGHYIRTIPNMSYIKYDLTASKPILRRHSSDATLDDTDSIYTVSITCELIMHPTAVMFEDGNEFEVNMMLPIDEKTTKKVSFKQGYKCKFAELPDFKARYGLTHMPGDIKYSEFPTSKVCSFDNLTITGDCNLPDHLVRNYSQLICCEETYRFKQYFRSIMHIIDSQMIPIEVECKQGARILKYTGFADFGQFNYVDQTKSRQAIPLVLNEAASPRKKSPETPKSKGKDNAKGKAEVQIESMENLPPSSDPIQSKNPYAECEDGYNTCLILEIEFDRPLITLKDNSLQVEAIRWSEHHKFSESRIAMIDKEELDEIFRDQILKVANSSYFEKKMRKSGPVSTSELWANVDDELFGTVALLVASKYNFNQPLQGFEIDKMLLDSYIYLINKSYEVLNKGSGLVKKDSEALIKFRIQCGEECRELGYSSAKHFYIMNLQDTSSSANCLLDYAIFNLRTGDTAKAMECCLDASKKNPILYDSYLIQAYILYLKRDRKSCEATLQYVTKACGNYLEAWVALFLLHVDLARTTDTNFISQNIENANAYPYIGHLHKLEPILWVPDYSSDAFIASISNYIKWGCIEFAQLALGYSVCKIGHDSYFYLLLTALTDYMNGRYVETLRNLNRIKTNCSFKIHKIQRLKAHCYLELHNPEVTSLLKILSADYIENNEYTPRCNLMNLKMAKFFIGTNKFKLGRYYLKKCCKKSGTYVSLIEFGNASVKCRSFDVAVRCFKAAHTINPFDWYHWSQLSIIYFRSGLIQQYRICAKNARENEISDENISHELDKIDEILMNQQQE